MLKFDAIELKKIIRTITEWMIDDYAISDIISQTIDKWKVDEKQALQLLDQVRIIWKKNEGENNEQKRLRKIESIKKLKRALSEKERTTPAGIMAILNVEKELFRLESMSFAVNTKKLLKELKLTHRQEMFCREYVKDLNGKQAAIRSGYSEKTARFIASENLTKPNVLRFVDQLQDELRQKADLTPEMVVQELRDLADFNIQDFLLPNNAIKDLTTIPRRQTKPVAGIKTTEKFLADGNRQVTTELKLNDKRAAWVDLGKHTGIFEKDNKQKSLKIKVTRK